MEWLKKASVTKGHWNKDLKEVRCEVSDESVCSGGGDTTRQQGKGFEVRTCMEHLREGEVSVAGAE